MSVKEKHRISGEDLMSLVSDKARYMRLAQIYVRNESDAEDIYHDCLLYLYDSRDKIMVSDIGAYFSITVKNRCLRFLKKQDRESPVDSSDFSNFFISRLEDNCESRTECNADFPELLKKCGQRLPKLTMDIFEAKRLEHMSYKEISRIFGVTENRINFEIKRALKVFREEFRDYHIFVEAAITVIATWTQHL